MPNERGRAKRDIQRAANNADRMLDRLMWLPDTYADYPTFANAVQEVCVITSDLKKLVETLLRCLP